jgi:hypothetical protein
VQAVSRIDLLNRQTLRTVFRQRFSVMRMAADHVRAYESLIARQRARSVEGIQISDMVP